MGRLVFHKRPPTWASSLWILKPLASNMDWCVAPLTAESCACNDTVLFWSCLSGCHRKYQNGKVKQNWNTRFGGLWFSIDKLLICGNGSTTCSLSMSYFQCHPLDSHWWCPKMMPACTPYENETVACSWFSANTEVIKYWCVALFSTDFQTYNAFHSYVEETTRGIPKCPNWLDKRINTPSLHVATVYLQT